MKTVNKPRRSDRGRDRERQRGLITRECSKERDGTGKPPNLVSCRVRGSLPKAPNKTGFYAREEERQVKELHRVENKDSPLPLRKGGKKKTEGQRKPGGTRRLARHTGVKRRQKGEGKMPKKAPSLAFAQKGGKKSQPHLQIGKAKRFDGERQKGKKRKKGERASGKEDDERKQGGSAGGRYKKKKKKKDTEARRGDRETRQKEKDEMGGKGERKELHRI